MASPNGIFRGSILKLKQKVSNEIDWNDKQIQVWKEIAEEKHAFYCSTLGDRTWESYTKDEELYLKLKIGFSLYGPPPTKDEQSEGDVEKYFDEIDTKKVIMKIVELIKSECKSQDIRIAFIYVIAWINEEYAEFPIIRVPSSEFCRESKNSSFIDSLGRLYKCWDDFLENNIFPKCVYCYPSNGIYSWEDGKVSLEYGVSPQSKIIKRLANKLDTVSNVAGLGSAAVLIAGTAVPLAAPLVAGAAATGITTSVWSTCRALTCMADRKKHSQSLSLADADGRGCWISLAAGILGAASTGAMQYTQFLAKNGRLLTKMVDIGNISVAGIGIINNIASMIKNTEFKNCSGFVLSILFFCHCSISIKTAKEVILEVQTKVNMNIELQRTPEHETFQSLLQKKKNSAQSEPIVKPLKTIDNKDTFFKELIWDNK